MDASAYPLIGLVVGSSVACTAYFFRNTLTDPCVRWDKQHRKTTISDLYETPEETATKVKRHLTHRDYFAHHVGGNPVSENHKDAVAHGAESNIHFNEATQPKDNRN